jgi:hypothetical protein
MNHGMVCFREDGIAARVWDEAESRGESVAIVTSKSVEYRGNWHGHNNWHRAFLRSFGEPAALDPEGYGQRPGFRHPTGEIARYEPESRKQFLYMLPDCTHTTAILRATMSDDEALRIFAELFFEFFNSFDIFFELSNNDVRLRKTGRRRLRDKLGFVHIHNEWGLFLVEYRYTPLLIYLSGSASSVEVSAELVVADERPGRLIEKW